MDQTFYCDTINAFIKRKETDDTPFSSTRTISQFQNLTIKKLKEIFPKMTDKCNDDLALKK